MKTSGIDMTEFRQHLFMIELMFHLGTLQHNRIAHDALGNAMLFFQEAEQKLIHSEGEDNDDEPGHAAGCVCADCTGDDLSEKSEARR